MSGKQSKKERKAAREAQREALRKQERQRTIFTMIVIAVVLVIGGVLIWVSLAEPSPEDEIADLLDDLEGEEGEEGEDAEDGPDPATPLEERPVACGAEAPPEAGAERETYDEPADVLEEGVDYRAVVETSCGTVVIDLDEERTPEAVNSFVFLAQEGFYDGQLIHRNATSIEVLQTGSPDDTGMGGPGYTLSDELETAEEEGYEPGAVAMANAGPDTAGSQFFLVYGEAFQDAVEAEGALEPIYTRFGTIVEGLDVVQQIADLGATGETPNERVYLESVTIEQG